MRINDEIHFAQQAQYLVKLEFHFSWQAAFPAILGDSRTASCCIFSLKKMRLRVDVFCSNAVPFCWFHQPCRPLALAAGASKVASPAAAWMNEKHEWEREKIQ